MDLILEHLFPDFTEEQLRAKDKEHIYSYGMSILDKNKQEGLDLPYEAIEEQLNQLKGNNQ